MSGGQMSPLTDVLAYVRRIFETAGVLAILAGLGAISVAAIGLYSVMAFEVERGLGEIGIRMAVGADRGRVLRSVFGRGLRRLVPGLAIGVIFAAIITPLFGIFLSGANPLNFRVFAVIVFGYITIGLAATLVPARRAASLDPVRVLRTG